jgi:hypothetical protein
MALQLPSGPINYSVDLPDPSQSFLQAFKTGTAITETRMAQEEAQRKAEQQQLISQAFQRLRQPGATAKDYADLAMMLPETQAKAVRESFSMLNEEQLRNTRTQAGQVFGAFRSGKPEIAISLLDRQIEAKRNSGDEEGAKFLQTWRDVAKENPTATEDFFGYVLSDMPGGKDVIDAAMKLGDEKRTKALFPDLQAQKNAEMRKAVSEAEKAEIEAKYAEKFAVADLEKKAADLGLTKAQTGTALASTKKLGVEIAQAALQLEALKATGGVDPEKKFAQEEKIRKEWQGRSKVYNELQGTYSNIESSSTANTGAGDIALITSFMKMLDPGSVVRETEFATARDTAGLFTQLENRLQKAKDGQLLKPEQRKQYVDLAKQYLSAAQKKAEQEKKDLNIVVRNYRLNPQNVFGETGLMPDQQPQPGAGAGGGRGSVNPPTVGKRNVTVDY